MTNLITTIQAAAEAKGYLYLEGDGRYFENNIQQAKLIDGQCGLMINIIEMRQIMENRQFNGEEEYDVQMFLFRKFESNTYSNLSETIKEKRQNRMDDLKNKLSYFVIELTQCSDIDLISPIYRVGYNVTAANVDGWFIDCKLKLFNQWPTNN